MDSNSTQLRLVIDGQGWGYTIFHARSFCFTPALYLLPEYNKLMLSLYGFDFEYLNTDCEILYALYGKECVGFIAFNEYYSILEVVGTYIVPEYIKAAKPHLNVYSELFKTLTEKYTLLTTSIKMSNASTNIF